VAEYPAGHSENAVRYVPPDASEYLELWYGTPELWDIEWDKPCKGRVAYCRCGEAPLGDVETLNKFPVVFVASEAGRRYHQQYIDTHVGILFGGIKSYLFKYIERDFSASPFVFGHFCSPQWRKGSEVALAAFGEAFDGNDDVCFVIKSPGEPDMVLALREKYKNDSRITIEVKAVSDRREIASSYYADAHCLVYTSLIEGMGRCLLEAMATGMPAIVARASSNVDVFHEDFGWWAEVDYGPTGTPLNPDKDSLVRQMLAAYENRKACRQKSLNARVYAAKNFGWEKNIECILSILNDIYTGAL
jgi:glycosyltransferase involved in cell wall biosynthesis